MDGRHPALARLDALVGRWTVQPKVEGVGTAWTEFAWQEGGLFLRQVRRRRFDTARPRRMRGGTTRRSRPPP